jgi:Icc-related predicted phosphoesterase
LCLKRIFFTTDVHASEKVFRKFLNAGNFYKANLLIIGGDITGKAIVPIISKGKGLYEATLFGAQRAVKSEQELNSLIEDIRDVGSYPYVTDSEEMCQLDADESKRDALFERLMVETVQRWVKMAETKLKGTGMRCMVTPGNDDKFCIDKILEESDYVINPEGKVLEFGDHEIIATGYSNVSPWKCPRDITEDDLYRKIEAMAALIRRPEEAIYLTHDPPYDTLLDLAPRLDSQLRPSMGAVQTELAHVGSTAVRKAIEERQPLVGLHGHIHESKGVVNLGRTLCINPGSEYGEGILQGAILNLSDGKIKGYLLTQG